ncbi:AAA domain-containing protein [Legionella drancourtii]|uniref:AAA domain-containing protein n=1 Tax=Legionella drancourtii TaxID=168933 RepID=UPI0009FD6277|nr:AAA domain-containing protein [Legionella drancourtii]
MFGFLRQPCTSIKFYSLRDALAERALSELKKFKSLYPELKIGTIHTTQGKESDIVILVLGGNPQSSGAKKWASERPNLLNVAISRAKRKLYVIGNRTHWKDFNYFDQMAKDLATLNEIQDENIVQAAAHSQTLFCADKITID